MVKDSTLPGAGKGLFAKESIPKGSRIVEYKGKITTWKDVDNSDGNNGYIYYVKKSHVIDRRVPRFREFPKQAVRMPGVVSKTAL